MELHKSNEFPPNKQ